MESIKLVIWDLDETFWKGTLSEEGVVCVQENVELIKWLTGRGIMNSIVSKNNFDEARAKLQEIGVWDYFVFPTIAWEGKGKLVKSVIEKCQLRPVNVLFLDDNHMNLEEAKFYNEGLHAELPTFIASIKQHPAFKGKDDSSHSRLQHYKILEDKYVDQLGVSDNEEFLHASEIKIQYIENLAPHWERLHEIINRTNQLNYTKKRLSEAEVKELVKDERLIKRMVKVTDKYGDYGITGFYAFDKQNHKLEHFIFSCRIINLGIEQFIYSNLDFPDIEVVPDVAVPLNDFKKPDWIKVDRECYAARVNSNSKKEHARCTILFKGECDLFQMLFYLNDYHCKIYKESNFNGRNNFAIHNEHTQILIDSTSMADDQLEDLEQSLPFIDRKAYKSKVFKGEYDVLVYSLQMDYTQNMYRHKESGVTIPFGRSDELLTDENSWEVLIAGFRKRKCHGIDRNFLRRFSDEFEHVGKISANDFVENLKWIRANVPDHIPIVFMNGAEVDRSYEWERSCVKRYTEMNRALDQFLAESDNCYLVDVRKFVRIQADITYSIRRYQRQYYKMLAQDLISIFEVVSQGKFRKRKIAITPVLDLFKPLYRGVRRIFAKMSD